MVPATTTSVADDVPAQTSAKVTSPLVPRWGTIGAPITVSRIPAVVWSGERLVVWGGSKTSAATADTSNRLSDGAAFDPTSGLWALLPAAPVRGGRAKGIGIGHGVVVMNQWGEAALLERTLASWTLLPPVPAGLMVQPTPRLVWASNRLIAVDRKHTYVLALGDAAWTRCPSPEVEQITTAWAVASNGGRAIGVFAPASTGIRGEPGVGIAIASFDPVQCEWSTPLRMPYAAVDVAAAIDHDTLTVTTTGVVHKIFRVALANSDPTTWNYTVEETPAEWRVSESILFIASADGIVMIDYGAGGFVVGTPGNLRLLETFKPTDDVVNPLVFDSLVATPEGMLGLKMEHGRVFVIDVSAAVVRR